MNFWSRWFPLISNLFYSRGKNPATWTASMTSRSPFWSQRVWVRYLWIPLHAFVSFFSSINSHVVCGVIRNVPGRKRRGVSTTGRGSSWIRAWLRTPRVRSLRQHGPYVQTEDDVIACSIKVLLQLFFFCRSFSRSEPASGNLDRRRWDPRASPNKHLRDWTLRKIFWET